MPWGILKYLVTFRLKVFLRFFRINLINWNDQRKRKKGEIVQLVGHRHFLSLLAKMKTVILFAFFLLFKSWLFYLCKVSITPFQMNYWKKERWKEIDSNAKGYNKGSNAVRKRQEMKAIFSLPGWHNDVVLNLKAEARNFQSVFFFPEEKQYCTFYLFITLLRVFVDY